MNNLALVFNRSSAFVPKLNIVEETPSEELRNKNHIMAAPAQVMYIMADLGPKDRSVAQSLTDIILQVMSAVTDIPYAIQNFPYKFFFPERFTFTLKVKISSLCNNCLFIAWTC